MGNISVVLTILLFSGACLAYPTSDATKGADELIGKEKAPEHGTSVVPASPAAIQPDEQAKLPTTRHTSAAQKTDGGTGGNARDASSASVDNASEKVIGKPDKTEFRIATRDVDSNQENKQNQDNKAQKRFFFDDNDDDSSEEETEDYYGDGGDTYDTDFQVGAQKRSANDEEGKEEEEAVSEEDVNGASFKGALSPRADPDSDKVKIQGFKKRRPPTDESDRQVGPSPTDQKPSVIGDGGKKPGLQ